MIYSNDEKDYREDYDYTKEEGFRCESLGNLNKIKCIKTMNSSFIDFYKTCNDFKPLLNEEINIRFDSNSYEDITLSRCMKECDIPLNIASKFPAETKFLNIDNLKDDKSFLKVVLEERKMVLVPYILDENPYIALLDKQDDSYILKHNLKGEGYDIQDLFILNLDKDILVFVGFKLDTKLNKLIILKIKNGKLVRAFCENEYYYSKVFLENLNNKEYKLITYINEVEKAYRVDIYSIRKNGLKKTNKFNKSYYKDLVKYYKDLIKGDENKNIYFYYLALTYEKMRDYKRAIDVIDNALGEDFPYPSAERLKELKRKFKRQFK